DRLARSALHDGLLEGFIVKGRRDARQQEQMPANCSADDREDSVHWFAVDRAKIDGFIEEAESDQRLRDRKDNGIADMRDGDAVTHARRAERFASQKEIEE